MRRPEDMIRDLRGVARHGCFNHQEGKTLMEAAEMIRAMSLRVAALESEIAARDQEKMDLLGVITPAVERGPEP